jgi:hypothetical protein
MNAMRAALALMCFGLAAAAQSATAPREFTATYEASYRGIRAGTLTFGLKREGRAAGMSTRRVRIRARSRASW